MNCFHATIICKHAERLIVFLLVLYWMPLQAQTSKSEYLLGSEEKLEMQVHIWGEVRNPGEYRVSYDTDMIELISIAGGPTKDANLNNVQLTRPRIARDVNQETLEKIAERAGDREITKEFLTQQLKASAREVVDFDVNKYLRDRDSETPPPVLKPGDIVHVKTTKWYRWREFIQALHQVALIASVYAWYLRSK